MSQGLNRIHTFVLGCSAELLEIRLANAVCTFVLGCSAEPLKMQLAGQTFVWKFKASLEAQIQPGSSDQAWKLRSSLEDGAATGSLEA